MYHVATSRTVAPLSSTLVNNKLSPDVACGNITSQSWPTVDPKAELIKTILLRVFDECETPYRGSLPYDEELHQLSLDEIKSKGYPFGSGPNEIDPNRYLRYGVVACCGYPHLSRKLQVFIAIYTALVMWIDDVHSDCLDGVEEFYSRFLAGKKQKSEGLECMANLIRETTSLYGSTSVQGSIIVMASLKFISGTLLEYETKKMTASGSNTFSSYLRSLTGLSEVYAMFTFPPETDVKLYIQAVPDISTYIHYYNDLLSFYKEEKRGETNNYVTLEATASSEDKLIVLDRLVTQVGECSRRIGSLLTDPAAASAWEAFKQGYLLFHTSLDRYQLGELFA